MREIKQGDGKENKKESTEKGRNMTVVKKKEMHPGI
jgi:hypothetical protein